MQLGAEPDGDHAMFNMAARGLRLAQRANGVSRLHGQVSRDMFRGLWSGFEVAEVPIGHVTNGVHAGTWVNGEFTDLFERRVGADFRISDRSWSRWPTLPTRTSGGSGGLPASGSSTTCAAG